MDQAMKFYSQVAFLIYWIQSGCADQTGLKDQLHSMNNFLPAGALINLEKSTKDRIVIDTHNEEELQVIVTPCFRCGIEINITDRDTEDYQELEYQYLEIEYEV